MKNLNLLKKYVPRHFRLGVCVSTPVVEMYHDVPESVPVVDDSGSVIFRQDVLKRVPVSETMKQYSCSRFRLSALVASGVPLKVVNVNSSSSVSIDKLYNVCRDLDNAEVFVNKVLEQRKERDSWITDFEK